MSKNIHHPAVAVNVVVFGFDGVGLNVLLVQRNTDPFEGAWSLPEGFLEENETVELSAIRILNSETGIIGAYMEQFGVFSEPARDPRERSVAVGVMALVAKGSVQINNRNNALRAAWFPIEELPDETVLDHDLIVDAAFTALRNRSHTHPVVFELLPFKFSISELQRIMEVLNNTEYDRRNFYRKVIATELLKPEGIAYMRLAHRPPQLFSFNREEYEVQMAESSSQYPFNF